MTPYRLMTPFEKKVELSFIEYSTAKIAFLQFLFPKMRMAGYIGKSPGFVQVAKAPYDVDGYYIGTGRYIACEIKENADHHPSMRLIPPDKDGTGLQYHQLSALVAAHDAGGLAVLLWDNGGEVGILDGTRLAAAKSAIDTSIKAAKEGYPDGVKGLRSVPWGSFQPVKINGSGVPLWLPLDKP